MPEHLEEYTVNEGLRQLVKNLEDWLKDNGRFEPGVQYFDKCTSPELGKQVGELFTAAVALFNTVRAKTEMPLYWGVAKARPGGGWMTNDHEQILIPVRITANSTPHIRSPDPRKELSFTPGKAVYFAPKKLAEISDDVEFFFVH